MFPIVDRFGTGYVNAKSSMPVTAFFRREKLIARTLRSPPLRRAARNLSRDKRIKPSDAATLAQIVSAVTFIKMADMINAACSVDDIIAEIAGRVRVMLPH